MLFRNVELHRQTNEHKKSSSFLRSFSVGPLGLEPRLFGTKNRRVASYTMGQLDGAKLITKINSTSKNVKKNSIFFCCRQKQIEFH